MNSTSVHAPRANGLVVLAVLVLVGIGVTAGYLQWKAPELAAIVASRRGAVALAPTTPEGRLHAWAEYGNAFMHSRLQQMRLSADQPWLATHAVGQGALLDIYGIDLSAMPRELSQIDGLVVRVRVPTPELLGHAALAGEQLPFVPVFREATQAPDPVRRAHDLVAWALEGVARALERDIPGTELVVEIDPATHWSGPVTDPAIAPREPR